MRTSGKYIDLTIKELVDEIGKGNIIFDYKNETVAPHVMSTVKSLLKMGERLSVYDISGGVIHEDVSRNAELVAVFHILNDKNFKSLHQTALNSQIALKNM